MEPDLRLRAWFLKSREACQPSWAGLGRAGWARLASSARWGRSGASPVTSVADPGCLSRILIFTHPGSRISDPGSKNRNKRAGWKKIWANFQTIIELFTKKSVTKLSKIWVWDPGSGIGFSGGQKGTGSRIRNTACQQAQAQIVVGRHAGGSRSWFSSIAVQPWTFYTLERELWGIYCLCYQQIWSEFGDISTDQRAKFQPDILRSSYNIIINYFKLNLKKKRKPNLNKICLRTFLIV